MYTLDIADITEASIIQIYLTFNWHHCQLPFTWSNVFNYVERSARNGSWTVISMQFVFLRTTS